MLQVENLSVVFNEIPIFSKLTFNCKKGELVVIKGDSGSGKSTVFNCLLGFVRPDEGLIKYDGNLMDKRSIHQIRQKTSWVPQELPMLTNSSLALFHKPHQFLTQKNISLPEKRIDEMLAKLRLGKEILSQEVQELSGGQKQRLLIASILLLQKRFLFLDEPTASLDEDAKKKVVDVLHEQKEQHIVIASHDDIILDVANQVIHLKDFKA